MKKKNLLLTFLLAALVLGGAELFAQKSLPYSCDFNISSLSNEGWTTSGTPTGGDNIYSSSGHTYSGHSETKCFRFSTNNGSYTEQYLISPEFETSYGLNVEFYHNSTSSHNIKIGYSTTNTSTSSFTWIDDQIFSSSSYTKYSKDINVPGIKYIAILFYNNTGAWQSKFLDDFTFTALDAPSSGTTPTGLTASPIKTYEATLTWNETENATSYKVKYHETSSTEWITETGLATNTLALRNLVANTDYEAQVQAVYSGGDSEWSTSYNFTTLPLKENKYDGTGWASAWNWEPSGVPTENHDVLISKNMPIDGNAAANNITIATGKTMTIQNGYSLTCNSITNNGNLVIEEGGQLICNYSTTATIKKGITAATNWGNETFYIPDGWYFIASPIDWGAGIAPGSVSNLLQGDYDLYRFNQAGADGEWENYKAHQNDDFNLYNEHGYLYANKNDVTLEFTGYTKPALNADSLLLVYNNQVAENMRGWNLVGNPYVFNAYANKPYYKINNDKDGVEPVSAYNANPIAPCTGIMVQATGDNQYVKFTKNAPAAPSKGSVELNLTGNGKRSAETLDKAIVSFNEGSELGKFYFGTPNANIYIPQNGKEFAMVSSEAQGEMPVNFKANVDGQYTITVNAEDMEMGYLHLIDNLTGFDIDLLATPSYTFNAKSDDYASRFRLVFNGSSIEESVNEEQPFAFISNGEIVINGTGIVQAFDMLGRQLFSHKVDSASSIPNSEFPAAGIYVLQLTNNENTRTQKIIVK